MKTRQVLAGLWALLLAAGPLLAGPAAVGGRYVRIELPQRGTPVKEGRILSVAEVEVFSGGGNVALRSTATQSKGRTAASVAIDGNTDGRTNATHSDVGAWDPWLEIDLGKTAVIESLVVWNRPKLSDRLNGFLVTVLDEGREVVWHKRFLVARPGAMKIVPERVKGVYVGVRVEHGARGWYDVGREGPAARGTFASDTLLPTGQFDQLPLQPIDPKRGGLVELDLGVPGDAARRMARFKDRNSAPETEKLCKRLYRVLKTDAKGLDRFVEQYRTGQYRLALEAYRAYFFDKLAHPEKYGAATENIFFEQVRDRGKSALLRQPSAFAVEQIMDGRAVALHRNELLVARIGPPGAVNWAPADLAGAQGATYARGPDRHAFWQSQAGEDLIRKTEFCRALNQTVSMYNGSESFRALIYSYAATGNREHLERWLAYVDDWTMNARGDIDRCPMDVRRATELETQAFRTHLNLLRVLLDERPGLARDFDAATLARHLMTLVTELPAYLIRAKRAEMANWGIMGTCHLLHVAGFLQEFRAMDAFRREAWRLWMSNFIQHRTLDGENCEAWDEGHNGVDIEYALDSVPFCLLPDEADALARREFWDLVRVNERSLLTHISPNGKYWPRWTADGGFRSTWQGRVDLAHNSLCERYLRLNPAERHPLDLVADEAGARSRIETLLTGGKPTGAPLPDRCSDVAPYAAMYFLRDGWAPGAEYLLMQNFLHRSQDTAIRDVPEKNRLGGSARTMYSLSKDAKVLVSASPIAVDRKPDNRWEGAIATGGKTAFCGQAGRHVVDTRFHTSARFDLAEARQDAPYSRPTQIRGDWYGLYTIRPGMDNTPVRDVTAYRQVFRVRGEGLTIVSDRIENRGGSEHEYAQFFTLPAQVPEKGFAARLDELARAGHRLIRVEPDARRLHTANVGFENISIRLFGQDLRFANRINAKGEHEAIPKTQIEVMRDQLARDRPVRDVIQRYSKRPISVRWRGAGNQALVTLLRTRPGAAEIGKQYDGDLSECRELSGPGGAIGCYAVTPAGTKLWYQTGPQKRNGLAAGPVQAQGESLLAVERNGQISGVGLSCGPLTVRGKRYSPKVASFEYVLAADGTFQATPIHTPIDTVRIAPAENVFTDTLEVTFDIPTQDSGEIEFRYTLDGNEPSLASNRYSGPVTIRQTTMVKVRPFRKGLKATPWHFHGTDSGKTITTIFRKEPFRAPVDVPGAQPGLDYEYMEGDWPTLFTYAGTDGVLPIKGKGRAAGLLVPAEVAAIRKTDMAYAIRYTGYVNVPASGVYAFHAPEHLYTTTMDAGYDLRVWIAGREWFPAPRLHSENTWFIPLQKGLHRLKVSFADYRYKTFRNEYWMAWQEEEMWQGMPKLEVSGPGVTRQVIPASWLWTARRD